MDFLPGEHLRRLEGRAPALTVTQPALTSERPFVQCGNSVAERGNSADPRDYDVPAHSKPALR